MKSRIKKKQKHSKIIYQVRISLIYWPVQKVQFLIFLKFHILAGYKRLWLSICFHIRKTISPSLFFEMFFPTAFSMILKLRYQLCCVACIWLLVADRQFFRQQRCITCRLNDGQFSCFFSSLFSFLYSGNTQQQQQQQEEQQGKNVRGQQQYRQLLHITTWWFFSTR